jgi:hypothetical protein
MRRYGVEFRNRAQLVEPSRLRANKYLPTWHQFISLAQRPNPHIISLWLITGRSRVERRPGLGAETLHTYVAAVGDLSILCGFAGQERERSWTSDDNRPQWSAAHYLAVCAIANGRRFGISLCLERHMSAVTASINFHDKLPLSIAASFSLPQTGMECECIAGRRPGVIGPVRAQNSNTSVPSRTLSAPNVQ